MEHEIIHLTKKQWQNRILYYRCTSKQYFDIDLECLKSRLGVNGFIIKIVKKESDSLVTDTKMEDGFFSMLYKEHLEDACAWGIVENGELIAMIETSPEKWNNRLRVTEIWVAEEWQKQGLGHALMEVAKEQARLERYRAILLVTQSCNVNAVDFCLHEGFALVGFNTCEYQNNDMESKKVRLEMGWFLPRKNKLLRSELDLREETPDDWYAVENMTREAFWNYHQQGCDEHYFVHKLRQHPDYLPKISRIACKDGEVIGCIMYSKAYVRDGSKQHDIVTFGPLCVTPEWRGCGVGEMLLLETMKLATAAGYRGIVIFGEPDYYPRVGFRTCDHFLITTNEGKNFDAFMAIELMEGGMKNIKGQFYESEIFDDIPKDKVEVFDRQFEPKRKLYFPSQWELVH